MIMAALGNALGGDVLRKRSRPELERALRPVIGVERFTTAVSARASGRAVDAA